MLRQLKTILHAPSATHIGLCAGIFCLAIVIVCVMYVSYLLGIRRIQHDTQLYAYAARAFLSDCLHLHVAPMWDPISNMGIPMGAAPNHSIYNPLAVLSCGLFHYTIYTVPLEFVLTALIAFYGAYAWLRIQDISTPLAFAGAIAYAGSPGLFNLHTCYPASISPALLPWLFVAADLIALGNTRRERWRGIIVGAICLWLLFVGGYIGLVLMLLPFMIIYVAGLMVINRSFLTIRRIGELILDTILIFILTLALVFVPLTEFLITYYGHFDELRRSYTVNFTPYLGALPYRSPLTLFLANGSGFGMVPGLGQMYVGAAIALLIPPLLLSRKLTARDYLLFALALITTAAAMGDKSPIAVLCVKFLPGFNTSRWHFFFACVPIILIIGFVMRGLEAFLANPTVQRSDCRRTAILAGVGLIFGLAATAIIAERGRGAYVNRPLVITTYDFAINGAVVLTYLAAFLCWSVVSRRRVNSDNMGMPHALTAVAIPLCALALAALGYSALSVEAHEHLLLTLGLSSVDAANICGQGLLPYLDSIYIPVSPEFMFMFDCAQAVLVASALITLLLKLPNRGPRWFAWAFVFLIAGDITLGMQRYFQANPYWLTTQVSLTRDVDRGPSISYAGNVRDLNTTYLGPPEWDSSRNFSNLAIMRREPTFRSYNPYVDTHMVALCSRPEGFQLCSRLIWFLSGEESLTLDDFRSRAVEPPMLNTKLMANTMDVTLQSTQPGRVVFTDAWSPGWRVTVNGQEKTVERVFDAVKAVRVTAGQSQIHFWYRPPYLKLGIILFIVAVLGLLLMAWHVWRSGSVLAKAFPVTVPRTGSCNTNLGAGTEPQSNPQEQSQLHRDFNGAIIPDHSATDFWK